MLLPVLSLLAGAFYFAATAVADVVQGFAARGPEAVTRLVQALDASLLAAVFVIFALGLYELFLSPLDVKNGVFSRVLEVLDLDDLKAKLGKVVIMLLVVKFFEKVQFLEPKTPLDVLIFAASIGLLAAALWLIREREG